MLHAIASSKYLGLMPVRGPALLPLTPSDTNHISKAQYKQGGGLTQNCRSDNINSDIAYHILTILQCPHPWWRLNQQVEDLFWRALLSGGHMHPCSSCVRPKTDKAGGKLKAIKTFAGKMITAYQKWQIDRFNILYTNV